MAAAAAAAVRALAVALAEGEARGYRCGDALAGRVLLELAAPLPLRALRLRAAGQARAAWSEGGVGAVAAVAAQAPRPAAAPPSSPADGCRVEAEAPCLDLRQELLRGSEAAADARLAGGPGWGGGDEEDDDDDGDEGPGAGRTLRSEALPESRCPRRGWEGACWGEAPGLEGLPAGSAADPSSPFSPQRLERLVGRGGGRRLRGALRKSALRGRVPERGWTCRVGRVAPRAAAPDPAGRGAPGKGVVGLPGSRLEMRVSFLPDSLCGWKMAEKRPDLLLRSDSGRLGRPSDGTPGRDVISGGSWTDGHP